MKLMINNQGGLELGGDKYNIQLVEYDSNNNQSTEVSAVNRLVFQDNVKFIISDGNCNSSWLSISDQNKVVVATGTANVVNLDPKWHYTFMSMGVNTGFPLDLAFFAQKFPDLMKTFVIALPDNEPGHVALSQIVSKLERTGVKLNPLFYPTNSTDLSSLGTKVVSLQPTAYESFAGGPALDGLSTKAVWQAGYRGQYFYGSSTLRTIQAFIPGEATEGMICPAAAVEFDPPLTQIAKDYMAAYVAKFGQWDYSSTNSANYFCGLTGAMQQAGSLDQDKMMAVINNSLKFTVPDGYIQMVARPDLGNNNTVDSITTKYYKKLQNGSIGLVATLTIEEDLSIWNKIKDPPKSTNLLVLNIPITDTSYKFCKTQENDLDPIQFRDMRLI